jgi:hypothetical protein
MSATTRVFVEPEPSEPGAHDTPAVPPTWHGTWTLRWAGVRTVTVLELRQRVRSTRWKLSLGIWFVVVGLVTWLTFAASRGLTGGEVYDGGAATVTDADGFASTLTVTVHEPPRGPVIFGVVVFFVLLAGMLVAPTLSAGTVNGDRNAGTLATLQVTLLSPAEIAVGKLLAGWSAAVAFLVASLPFVILALTAGGVRVLSLVVTLVLLVVLLGVVCAIGLGFSALVSRTTASALLTYLAVLGLSIGTVLVFVLTFPLVSQTDHVRTYESGSSGLGTSTPCAWHDETVTQAHTERTWWLLAANPFVVVADAAPQSAADPTGDVFDPLGAISEGVRELRAGPAMVANWCDAQPPNVHVPSDAERASHSPVWPWGLAADLVVGAAGLWVAVRRLRIPQTKLARGTRVA